MADKKIKDSELSDQLQKSKSYCVKSLWGIPGTFYRILRALNTLNQNTNIGYELSFDLEAADTDEDEAASMKTGAAMNPSFKGSNAPK